MPKFEFSTIYLDKTWPPKGAFLLCFVYFTFYYILNVCHFVLSQQTIKINSRIRNTRYNFIYSILVTDKYPTSLCSSAIFKMTQCRHYDEIIKLCITINQNYCKCWSSFLRLWLEKLKVRKRRLKLYQHLVTFYQQIKTYILIYYKWETKTTVI